MATQPQNPAAAQAETPRKKSKLMLVAAAVLTLAAGGGGAWYVMRPADPNAPGPAHEAKPAVFLPLENFTVNLFAQDGQAQYLQAGLTLKLGHDVKVEVIKERMPEIRNRILLVLSGKKPSELLPVAGKQKLAREIADAVKEVVGAAALGKPAAHPAAVAQAAPAPGEAGAASMPAAEATKGAAPAEGAKPAAVAAVQPIEVLFTSFIIQ
jgi:flagellar FliL protein